MDPFIGEIRLFPFGIVPKGWAACNGQLLPINSNQALFALLSTVYGGNGSSTFGLPDLRGRTPIGVGTSREGFAYVQGAAGGAESWTLQPNALPTHFHAMNAVSSPGTQPQAGGGRPSTVGIAVAGATPVPIYTSSSSGSAVVLAADTVGLAGGGAAHNNVQPSLVLNYCIAVTGIFPSRS